MKHSFVQTGNVRLHYVEQGEGPAVVLLHGFPDFWYSWRKQLPSLSAAGYRAIAPDLRGYNQSDRPQGVAQYKLELLADDVAGLIRELVGGPAVVVGHDWGGVVAWHLATHHRELVRGLVILNAPHPAAYFRELRRPSTQILRSWYVGFFQIPKLAEAILSARDFALLRRALRDGPAEDEADVERYVDAFRRPGALTAAINYYRAAARHPRSDSRRVDVPTLVLWGDRDPFLVRALADGLEKWVPDLEVVHLADAGHWLHHSHAQEVNRRVIDFITCRPTAYT